MRRPLLPALAIHAGSAPQLRIPGGWAFGVSHEVAESITKSDGTRFALAETATAQSQISRLGLRTATSSVQSSRGEWLN